MQLHDCNIETAKAAESLKDVLKNFLSVILQRC